MCLRLVTGKRRLDRDTVQDCSIHVQLSYTSLTKESVVAEVVHTSRLRIERVKGPIRQAFLEGFDTPIRFGVHGGIKAFYGVEPDEDVPATLDHMVAAVGA